MNSQELRNLQEAYMKVVEGVRPGNVETPLDKAAFKKRRRSLARKEASADAEKRGHVSTNIVTHGRKYSPDEAKRNRENLSDYEREQRKSFNINPDQVGDTRETADKTKNPKKLRKQKAMGELGEQKDIYDIILSHLLDEGYAETIESAEAIMVNMSEEWRDSIVEDVLDEAAVDWEMSSSEMEKARNERKFGKQSFNQVGQTKLRRELHKSQRGMKKKDVRRWEGTN